MSRLFTIAAREFTAMVGTKAFLLTLVMMPILMLGGIVVMPLVNKMGSGKERRIVVADGSQDQRWLTLLETAAESRNAAIRERSDSVPAGNSIGGIEYYHFEAADSPLLDDDKRLQLSDQIRDGDLYGILEIPAAFGQSERSADEAKFVSQDGAIGDVRGWAEEVLRQSIRESRLKELGIDAEVLAHANTPVVVTSNSPYQRSDDGKLESKSDKFSMVAIFLPFGVMMLMFVVIFLAAQPMLESAMEEKQYRIAELLLGCVSPRELMTGKLLGNVAGSFVTFTVYAIGAIFVVNYNDWPLDLDWSRLPWVLVFQVLGVLLFSSIFLTIGASVSELKEAQSLLLPVWLLLMAPLMVWFSAVRDPNGVIATTLSFFPPSAPLMMATRLTGPQTIPWWQPPLAALVMLVSTMLILAVAARIYRASLLRTDSAGSLAKIFGRLRSGG